ncbi:hypothetical protein AnigIFM50267_004574 [Aspergillus niger]|nr:hypothetical protein AnigIFM50267_004574 [Aspergillus niger]
MGPQPKMPKSTGIQGYPTAGESPSYSGLCSFACNYGNCIEGVCVTVEVPLIIPTVSHFTPDTCTAGTGSGALAGLCSYGCNVGYCPIHNYTCTATDPLNLPALRVFPPPETIVDCATLPASEVTVPILHEVASCSTGDGSDPACTETPSCDFSRVFSTLDALAAAVDALEPACIDFYTLDGLLTVLQQTLTNYTGITSSYDDKFNDYVKYIKEIIPDQLTDFMRTDTPYGPGNAYFQCTYSQNGRNHTRGSCPGDIGIDTGTFTVYYDLVDAEGFYGNLSANYGIDKTWIEFGKQEHKEPCTPQMYKNGCAAVDRTYIGFPVKAADSAITVTNPKDIMTQALPNIQNLTDTITTAKIEIALGSWMDTDDDIVQSLSLAVFLLSQAVASMQSVVAVAESYEAAQKKKMINEMLMGVLLVVPFVGELDAVADVFAGLSRIITLIGDAGAGATTVYAIVEDPKMAPLTILETLLLGGMRDPQEFSTMGAARRGMSRDDIKGLGSEIEALDDQFQSIVAKCLSH